jgi:hypothetical protein
MMHIEISKRLWADIAAVELPLVASEFWIVFFRKPLWEEIFHLTLLSVELLLPHCHWIFYICPNLFLEALYKIKFLFLHQFSCSDQRLYFDLDDTGFARVLKDDLMPFR